MSSARLLSLVGQEDATAMGILIYSMDPHNTDIQIIQNSLRVAYANLNFPQKNHERGVKSQAELPNPGPRRWGTAPATAAE